MTRNIRILAVAVATLAAAPARSQVPQVFTYTGYLKDSGGTPVTSSTNLTFRLYTAPAGGAVAFAKTIAATPTSDGWFSVVLDLGTGTPAIASLAALDQVLYLGIQVESEAELSPRAQVTPSLGALAVDWAGVQGKPACGAGQFLSLDGSGNLTCATPASGGVASLAAGATGGITLSASTGAVTLSLPTCAANQILQFSGTTWGCVAMPAGGGGVSSVGAAPPLASTGGATPVVSLDTAGCSAGQVLKLVGSAWACAADAGIAAVTHDATLVGNGAGTPLGVATGAFQAPITGGPCIAGQFVTSVNPSSGAITCSPELGTGSVSSVAVGGAPLSVTSPTSTPIISISAASGTSSGYITASDYLNFSGKISPPAPPCSGGQVLGWSGTAWVCATTGTGTVTSVTGTSPVSVATGTTTPVISIATAAAGVTGALSGTDWTTFNSKVGSLAVTSPITNSGTAAAPNIGIATANGVTPGALSAADYARLNPASCAANQIPKWSGSAWTCAADNVGGTVTSVTASPPLSSSGGAAPNILIATAGTVTAGALSAADWNAFSGKQARVTGTCGAGAYVNGVNADGSVTCGYLPRFASAVGGATTYVTNFCVNYLTVTVAAPGPGTIVVESIAWVQVSHAYGTTDGAYAFIGTSAADCADNYGRDVVQIYGVLASSASSTTYDYEFTVTPRRAIPVGSAGAYTFYLNAYNPWSPRADAVRLWYGSMHATWHPN